MPRGKQKPLSERIQLLQDAIQEQEDRKAKADQKIAEIKQQLEPLLNEQEINKLKDVKAVIDSTGLSPDEVIKKLTGETESA